MNITYSRATSSDIAQIYLLCKQLIDAYENVESIDYDKVLKWVQKKIETSINEYTAVYADGKKAGYYHFYKNEDGEYEIDDLYIFDNFQSKGIGTEIIKKCCSSVDEPVMLYVFINNKRAVSLYKRLGFEIVETIRDSRYIMRSCKKYIKNNITFELLSDYNIENVRKIQREDISEDFVDTVDTIMELTQYGNIHNCKGHTYAIKLGNEYIGLILLSEAFEWDTDPEEMKDNPFYRLMGFVIDKRYRNSGIGGYALEKVIEMIYGEYGVRPIALGVHKDNIGAARFYQKHGFQKTDVMEGNDFYYLRYPKEERSKK